MSPALVTVNLEQMDSQRVKVKFPWLGSEDIHTRSRSQWMGDISQPGGDVTGDSFFDVTHRIDFVGPGPVQVLRAPARIGSVLRVEYQQTSKITETDSDASMSAIRNFRS